MADVVRNGAIFRVKNPSTMRSPMPRLPVARGRIASATPETPAAKRGAGRVRSALERVVPRAPVAPLPPQQQQRAAANDGQQRPRRRLKKVNKKGVAPRKVQPSKDEDDVSVRASFNRLVSETETRQAAKRAESDSSGSKAAVRKDAVATTSEEGEEEQSVEEREASSDTGEETPEEQQPRARGRKRPRVEPEDEPTEEEDEEEEEEDASSEEMVTPQPRRRKDESASDIDGAGDEDEDGVTVQKRLVYDDTPPAKAKIPPPKKKAKPATTPVERKPKAKAKTSEERVPVAAGGLEFQSMSSAATPSRSTRIRTGVLLMSEWYVDWPPPFEGDQLQLVVHGQVLGQSSSFTVQRRVTDVQFISTENQNVRLNGCLDIERAQQADVPPVVMELLVEGIPTNWRQLLDAYAPPPDPWMPLSVKSKEKAKQKKARAAAAAEAERQSSVPIPGVTKPTPKSSKKSTKANASPFAIRGPMTPAVEKRSRSGRRLTPVMEWWRNERKVVDLNFETKIVEGSPSYLPSKRSVARSDAANAARMKIQEIYDAQRKSAEWSDAQLTALHDAKAQVPTTHASFWGEVAKRVPGKSADECRARSFDDLPIAPTRKGTGGGRAAPGKQQQAASQVPVKIHRAGSNLFKKQVRQFVRDQEQKNVDDLFSIATPSKDTIVGGDFDDLKSPDAPMVESRTQRDGGGDESDEDGGPGRELLEKVPLSKRDDVDSYVRNLKRGNETLGLKAVRTSNAASAEFTTPPAKKKPRREGVHMTTEVGTHVLEGIVTPNGTTRVLVERGSDDEEMGGAEDEEDEEAELSDTYA